MGLCLALIKWIGTKGAILRHIGGCGAYASFAQKATRHIKRGFKVSFGYGDDDQLIDPIIDAAFANIGSDFRQRGVYRITMRCDWGANKTNIRRFGVSHSDQIHFG